MIKRIRRLIFATSATLMLLTSTEVFAHAEHCEDTELGDLMKSMKDDLKGYVKGFKQSDQKTMQKHLNELISDSKNARTLMPLKYESQSETSVNIVRYQEGMDKLVELLYELKQAGDDNSAIKPLLAEVKKASKKGHDAFRKDCD